MNSFRPNSQTLVRSAMLVLSLGIGWSCQAGAADAPKAGEAAPAGPKVLATVNGAAITQQEVEAKVLEQILQRQPNLIETALAQVQKSKAGWNRADLTAAINDALPDYLGVPDGQDVHRLLDSLPAKAKAA